MYPDDFPIARGRACNNGNMQATRNGEVSLDEAGSRHSTTQLKRCRDHSYSSSRLALNTYGGSKKLRVKFPDHRHRDDYDTTDEDIEVADRHSNDSDSIGSSPPAQVFDQEDIAEPGSPTASTSPSTPPRSTYEGQSTVQSPEQSQLQFGCCNKPNVLPASPPPGDPLVAERPFSPSRCNEILSANPPGHGRMSSRDPSSDGPTRPTSPDSESSSINPRDVPPPDAGGDDPSTEPDSKSSQTQDALAAADADDSGDESDTELATCSKRILGAEEGKLFYAVAKGKLCYVAPQKVKRIDELKGLSLIDVISLDLSGVIPLRSATSESSGGSSTSSNLSVGSGGSSSGGASSSRRTGSRGGGTNLNTNKNQQGQDESAPTTMADVLGSSRISLGKRNGLRCPFNACFPNHRCFNNKKKKSKFDACSGPGYLFMQHLKEHIGRTHRVQRPKWKCGRCQDTFETEKKFQDHMNIEDCQIRCSECNQEFASKAARNSHHDERHSRQDTSTTDVVYVDDGKYAEMKTGLKKFTESLRKGKGITQEGLEQWISNNTEAFMTGRDPDINPQLQLGQWYITFTTLFPRVAVPKDPFYDAEETAMGQEGVHERFMFIWRGMYDIKCSSNGPPPTDQLECRLFHERLVQQTLEMANNTQILRSAWGKLHEPIQDQGLVPLSGYDVDNFHNGFSQYTFPQSQGMQMPSSRMPSGPQIPVPSHQDATFVNPQTPMQPFNTDLSVGFQYAMNEVGNAMPGGLATDSTYRQQQYDVPTLQPNYRAIPGSYTRYSDVLGPEFQSLDPAGATGLQVQDNTGIFPDNHHFPSQKGNR